jgi:hypothetical protein
MRSLRGPGELLVTIGLCLLIAAGAWLLRQARNPTLPSAAFVQNVTLQSPDGSTVRLDKILKGRSQIRLYVFSPSCPACRAINERLRAAGPGGCPDCIGATAISLSRLAGFERKEPLPFPVFRTSENDFQRLAVRWTPAILRIDRRGGVFAEGEGRAATVHRLAELGVP